MEAVARIADAVLYEGYLLWPYRRSALKNQRRWTFGGVYPQAHNAVHDDDPWRRRTECLLEGAGDAQVRVRVRFLHVVERCVARAGAHGLEPVDELEVGGRRVLSWEEAVEREVEVPGLGIGDLPAGRQVPIAIARGEQEEELRDDHGRLAGVVTHRWRELQGAVDVRAQRRRPGLWRLTVMVTNTTPWAAHGAGAREDALKQTFCSTHAVLEVARGAFVSQTDPPVQLREEAAACRNDGTWPVLVGEPGERHTLLSSPIILEDHPRIAPESPGDLFDGGEIDQLLILNILTLTDEEKAEMRDSDPRAREILERCEALSEEELLRLHGAVRELHPSQEANTR
jgi:hypothetical protein